MEEENKPAKQANAEPAKEETTTLSETSAKDELKERKEAAIKYLQQKKTWLIYVVMLAIAWFGYYIRTRNLPLLQGKWLPDVDSYAFLRYAEYIAEHGRMMAFDHLRYYPFGFDPTSEFGFLSYTIAYLQKILQIFNPDATTVNAAILYPALSFFAAAIFFFLFVKKLFNYKAAIVSTAFLAVVPAFLYRTMAGVSDKEALAVVFFFAALYFYTSAMKSEKPKVYIANAILAGISIGLTGAVWGGVQFLFLTFGLHAILSNFFDVFKKRQIISYSLCVLSMIPVLHIVYPIRYGINLFLTSTTTQILLLGLLMGIVTLLLTHKKLKTLKLKLEAKLPLGLFNILFVAGLGVIALISIKGPGVLSSTLSNILDHFIRPFAGNRWQITVAENHQPYFVDWVGQFSWKYIFMFMGGAVALFASLIKETKLRKTTRWALIGGCAVFSFIFAMNRYSASSIFNGETGISKLVYLGSLMAFLGLLGYGYVKSYYHNKNLFESIKQADNTYILLLVWFIVMLVAARSAIRMLFILAPVTAVLTGYLAVESFEWTKRLKKDAYKIAGYLLIGFIIITTFYGFSKSVLAQASYVGPSFNSQWQNSMSWVKENTPEDAIFAHWWDYGYWVQWGANRATISDGGNAYGGINYFVGRHVLTAQNETEALEFLKARNVSYLLIVSDEIGKYPAYSSIGADRNYDRYSWISTFTMQPNQIRETRDETIYLFAGGTPLDDDFVYQGRLFPAGSSGVGAVLLPIKNVNVQKGNETKVIQKLGQPTAVLVYNGQQTNVPLRCVYFNGQEIVFDGSEMLEGCLRVMPTIEGNGRVNPIGAALYLSPEIYRGLFAKLYLLNQNWQHIKLAYSDENTGMPLALYQGRLIGPHKIWKIDYPEGLNIPPEYYKNEVPDPEVEKIKGQ